MNAVFKSLVVAAALLAAPTIGQAYANNGLTSVTTTAQLTTSSEARLFRVNSGYSPGGFHITETAHPNFQSIQAARGQAVREARFKKRRKSRSSRRRRFRS